MRVARLLSKKSGSSLVPYDLIFPPLPEWLRVKSPFANMVFEQPAPETTVFFDEIHPLPVNPYAEPQLTLEIRG